MNRPDAPGQATAALRQLTMPYLFEHPECSTVEEVVPLMTVGDQRRYEALSQELLTAVAHDPRALEGMTRPQVLDVLRAAVAEADRRGMAVPDDARQLLAGEADLSPGVAALVSTFAGPRDLSAAEAKGAGR